MKNIRERLWQAAGPLKFAEVGMPVSKLKDPDSNWISTECKSMLSLINSNFDVHFIANICNLDRYLGSLNPLSRESWKDSIEELTFLMNLTGLCVLLDCRVIIRDSFLNLTKELSACLQERTLNYSVQFFINPLNSNIVVQDMSVLLFYVYHRGYTVADDLCAKISCLTTYIKHVFYFNLMRMVNLTPGSDSQIDKFRVKVCEKFPQPNKNENADFFDMFQLIILVASYEDVAKRDPTRSSDPNLRELEDKTSVFVGLYRLQNAIISSFPDPLMKALFDKHASRFVPAGSYDDEDDESLAVPLNKLRPTQTSLAAPNDQRPRSVAEIELVEPEQSFRTITPEQLNTMVEFDARYFEYVTWKTEIGKKSIDKFRELLDGYKNKPVSTDKLQRVVDISKDTSFEQKYTGLRDETEKGNLKVRNEVELCFEEMNVLINASRSSHKPNAEKIKDLCEDSAKRLYRLSKLCAETAISKKRDDPTAKILTLLTITDMIISLLDFTKGSQVIRNQKTLLSQRTAECKEIRRMLSRLNPTERGIIMKNKLFELVDQKDLKYITKGESPEVAHAQNAEDGTNLKKRIRDPASEPPNQPVKATAKQQITLIIDESSEKASRRNSVSPARGNKQAQILQPSSSYNSSLLVNAGNKSKSRSVSKTRATNPNEIILEISVRQDRELMVSDISRYANKIHLKKLVNNGASIGKIREFLRDVLNEQRAPSLHLVPFIKFLASDLELSEQEIQIIIIINWMIRNNVEVPASASDPGRPHRARDVIAFLLEYVKRFKL